MTQGEDESSAPTLELFTPEVAAITLLSDQMSVALARLETLVTHKPPQHQPQPLPRPQTAFDRVRFRITMQGHLELVDEVEEARRRRQV